MVALAFLMVVKVAGQKGAQFQEQEIAQLLLLTVSKVRGLLWLLVRQAPNSAKPVAPEGLRSLLVRHIPGRKALHRYKLCDPPSTSEW